MKNFFYMVFCFLVGVGFGLLLLYVTRKEIEADQKPVSNYFHLVAENEVYRLYHTIEPKDWESVYLIENKKTGHFSLAK